MIFYDTETCGLHGLPVLIQYAEDDRDIKLYNFWKEPIYESLKLIEWIMDNEVVGFNLSFDHFHLCKMYTVLNEYHDHDAFPEDIIDELAELEPIARDGPCLKPAKALDLMLHARKGPYQSTMDRHDIRIKRVPTALAWQLAEELEKRIHIDDIYFARRKNDSAEKWIVDDIVDEEGKTNPDFKDVVLRFRPSSALKALATDALGMDADSVLLFTDVELPKKLFPEELGYAPFAKAIGNRFDWKGAWPEVIHHHINHWEYSSLARKYAKKDVEITRKLYYHFGSPELGDDDSELACMVAAVRWKGYKIDIPGIRELKSSAIERSKRAPTAPNYVKNYIWPFLSDQEKLATGDSTKKVVLESMEDWAKDCEDCDAEGCDKCGNTGEVKHPAAIKAKEVLDARVATKEIELYDKLLKAGRFHASFKVIGTLSSRMAGADGLNPQGIKGTTTVRSKFPLAFDDMILCGGDFESFEVALTDANYYDPKLREDLLSGKKIHALFGVELFPEETYDSIVMSKGTDDDKYTKGKQGVFAQIYFGNDYTLTQKLGVSEDRAKNAFEGWKKRYPGIAKEQQRIVNMFQSMTQPGGIGSRVAWKEPADYIDSMFGFRRYFTLENQICKALFELANDPPKSWNQIRIKLVRRDREQFVGGAVRSALFAAAFAIQGANTRAAGNHLIQSSGAIITKHTQRKIWDLQPNGVAEWIVQPMNIHDEILTPIKPDYVGKVNNIVKSTVESFRDKVPLIAMDWSSNLETWADK